MRHGIGKAGGAYPILEHRMPMTVKVGLTRKLGQPEFGSLGASCDAA